MERARPSKATSRTRPWAGSARTARTGPKRSVVLLRTQRSISSELGVGEAEVGLADRQQLARRAPDAEGVVGVEARALAVAALGVHQHRVDEVRVALPLPPEALGAAGDVGAVAALQHDALDDRVGRGGAQRGEVVAGGEGQERREVDAGRVEGRDQGFEGGAALGEGERAEVAGAELQEVVGAQVRRVAAQVGGADGLAVQPLLQVGEAGDAAGLGVADQELAVDARRRRSSASTRSGKAPEMSSPVRE